MAYVAGLYTAASKASDAERESYARFLATSDAMAERERQAKMRQQQAGMDQFTAGLTPRSDVAVSGWGIPPAPPAPDISGGGDSGGGVGAPGTPVYERTRLARERKLLEQQYATETATLKGTIDAIGKQKYVLQQQLTVAPPSQAQMIRDEIARMDVELNNRVAAANDRVSQYHGIFKTLDAAIRGTDKGQAIMSGGAPAAPGAYTPGAVNPAGPAMPAGLGTQQQAIPVPDTLGMLPEAAQPAPAAGLSAAPTTAPQKPPAVVDTPSQTFIASLTAAQFNAMPKEQQDKVLAAVNRERQANRDRANFLTVPAAASDLAARPLNALAYIFNWASEAGDLPRYARAIGLGDIESIQVPYLGADPTATSTPYSDLVTRLREASVPLTREQFLANLAANEQAGKGDMQTPPAAGLTPQGQTPPTAGVQTLQPTADVAIGDAADPKVAAITQYSAQTVAARAPALSANINKAVASEQGQAIINRAKALGVDPAAAMAVYGIESSFGAGTGTSGAGAKGPLQVMPDQAQRLKVWFTTPTNIQRYGIPQEVVDAARGIDAGSIDAGLLQLKYNELIGLPKNLWGAGYQGNADEVRKAGAPLPVHDAGNGTKGLTNSDYNKLYVELYNSAAQVVNIPPSTDTPTAGVVGNSQQMRTFDMLEQQIFSEFQFQKQQIETERQQATAKRQELARRMEIARQYSDLTEYDRLNGEIEALDKTLTDSNATLRTAETKARMEIEQINLNRTGEYINMAVMDLEAQKPKAFADMVTRGTGMLVEIQPIEGGKFAVWENNQLISGMGYSLDQVKDRYLVKISEAYNAQRAKQIEEERAFQSDLLKEDLKLARDITLEQIKASGEMEKQGWKESKENLDPATGVINERWYTKGDQIIRMRIAPDREEGGLVIKGGVTIERVDKAGMKTNG